MFEKLKGLKPCERCEIDVCSAGYVRIMIFDKANDTHHEVNIYDDMISGMTFDFIRTDLVNNLGEDFTKWSLSLPVFKWWIESMAKKQTIIIGARCTKELYRIKEVAHIFSISSITVRRMIKDGRLDHVMVGGSVRVKGDSVRSMLDK